MTGSNWHEKERADEAPTLARPRAPKVRHSPNLLSLLSSFSPACRSRSRKYSFQLSGNSSTRNARRTRRISASLGNLFAT